MMIALSAAALAKKHGLEQYLDKPEELNDRIFNLMLLQETMQQEKMRAARPEKDRDIVSVKRTAHGKFIAACSGDVQYGYAVETALKASTAVLAVFQRKRFIKLLATMGVPDAKVAQFCDSVVIDDDTHCLDQE